MNAAIATPIAPVTAEIATAPAKITDWTEADFRAQVNVFVNSQKEFVNGVTRCTLYAVRAAMMNSNNQPLNYILGNLSESCARRGLLGCSTSRRSPCLGERMPVPSRWTMGRSLTLSLPSSWSPSVVMNCATLPRLTSSLGTRAETSTTLRA